MTTKFTALAKTTAFAIASIGFSGAAHAECSSGFLADLACQAGIIDQDTAQGLDCRTVRTRGTSFMLLTGSQEDGMPPAKRSRNGCRSKATRLWYQLEKW